MSNIPFLITVKIWFPVDIKSSWLQHVALQEKNGVSLGILAVKG